MKEKQSFDSYFLKLKSVQNKINKNWDKIGLRLVGKEKETVVRKLLDSKEKLIDIIMEKYPEEYKSMVSKYSGGIFAKLDKKRQKEIDKFLNQD